MMSQFVIIHKNPYINTFLRHFFFFIFLLLLRSAQIQSSLKCSVIWSERWGFVLVYRCSESVAFEVPVQSGEGVSVNHLTLWSPWNRISFSSHPFRLLTWSARVQYYKINKTLKEETEFLWNSTYYSIFSLVPQNVALSSPSYLQLFLDFSDDELFFLIHYILIFN